LRRIKATVNVVHMATTEKHDAQSPRGDVTARLRVGDYDVYAARKGAKTVVAAAGLHGMGRTRLFDYRSGRKTPNLPTAMKMARDLGTTVEKLFELTDGRRAA
jgi:hypothetical protein